MLGPLAMVVWLHFKATSNSATFEIQKQNPFTTSNWVAAATITPPASCSLIRPRRSDPYFSCSFSTDSQWRYRVRACNPIGCSEWATEEMLVCFPLPNGDCPLLFPQQP